MDGKDRFLLVHVISNCNTITGDMDILACIKAAGLSIFQKLWQSKTLLKYTKWYGKYIYLILGMLSIIMSTISRLDSKLNPVLFNHANVYNAEALSIYLNMYRQIKFVLCDLNLPSENL